MSKHCLFKIVTTLDDGNTIVKRTFILKHKNYIEISNILENLETMDGKE